MTNPPSRQPPQTPSNPTSAAASTPPKKRRILPKLSREDIYTVPNLLTTFRLALSPCIGYCVHQGHLNYAFGLFAVAGITDMLDGYIARRFKSQTVLGSVLDPLADKVLMTTLTVTLAQSELLPVPLAALILGRDLALIAGAVYYRYVSLPEPKSLQRYFDPALPTVQIRPTYISKVNTALQLVLMGCSLAVPVLAPDVAVAQHVLFALHYGVAGTTAASGLSYLLSKDAVTMLRRKRRR